MITCDRCRNRDADISGFNVQIMDSYYDLCKECKQKTLAEILNNLGHGRNQPIFYPPNGGPTVLRGSGY